APDALTTPEGKLKTKTPPPAVQAPAPLAASDGSTADAAAEGVPPEESDGASMSVAPTGPLTDAQREIFWGSEDDQSPEVLNAVKKENYDTHFLYSDELHQYLLAEKIEGIGGGYIGVGTDQGWLFMGWQRPSLAWLADYDAWVVAMQWSYLAFFETSATPQEFIEKWSKESKKSSRALLKERFASHPDSALILRVFDHARHLVAYRLRRIVRMGKNRRPTFLTDDAQYQFLRTMVKEGRVRPLIGNLLADKGYREISAAATKLGVPIRHLYISNAEDYWRYPDTFRMNMRSLPGDEMSIVSRTRASKHTNNDYRYMQQHLENFNRWLRSDIKRSRDMWKNRPIKEDEIPYTWFTKEPPVE
ncbi:MAG: hypothetical protein ACPHRO_13055, partial [Nannocystaceae bacterium]